MPAEPVSHASGGALSRAEREAPDDAPRSGWTFTTPRGTFYLGWPSIVLWLCALPLAFFLTRLLVYARTWPVVHDAAVMRYVVFMIGSGRAPYLQMLEMNLPGALMSEWFGMHVFGAGAAGLWRWDTFMGLLAVAGAAWIAGRGFRVAGACGAMFTWALHLNDAAFDFAERDWLVAALLLLALACAAQALQRRNARWMAPCVALAGWACAIKPFALPLPLALVAVALWRLHTQRRGVLLWTLAGGLLPTLATVLYFAHWPGAFTAFLHTEQTVGAWYGTLAHATWHRMLFGVLLYPVLAALALAVYLYLRGRGWLRERENLLALGTVCGLFLYFAQHKGFAYHIYPFVLCTAVLGFIVAQRSLAAATWDRRITAVLFLLLCAVRLPAKFWAQRENQAYPVGTQQALIADLQALGGHSLSGHIQCLDMTLGGCIGALYDLRLVQTTGYVNDHMLFPYPETESPILPPLQERFLAEMAANPPRVIVLTAHNWPHQDDRDITKLQRWPAFATWLAAHYREDHTHIATTAKHTASYRIYVQR